MPKGNKGITLEIINTLHLFILMTEAERNAIGIYTVEIDETNKKVKSGISILLLLMHLVVVKLQNIWHSYSQKNGDTWTERKSKGIFLR